MTCFTALTYIGVIDLVLLSVQDFGPRGCKGINGTPWTPDRVREYTIGVGLFYCDISASD
jgi:hypothetical protein